MFSLFKKKVPVQVAALVLVDTVRERLLDPPPLHELVSGVLDAGGIDRTIYAREDVFLLLFSGEVAVRMAIPGPVQDAVLDSSYAAIDALFQSDGQYCELRSCIHERLQTYRHALSTTDTSPATMTAVGRAFSRFCTGEERFNLAVIADMTYKTQLRVFCEYFRSVKIAVAT